MATGVGALQNSITSGLNTANSRDALRLIQKRMRQKITNETWEQIKTAT